MSQLRTIGANFAIMLEGIHAGDKGNEAIHPQRLHHNPMYQRNLLECFYLEGFQDRYTVEN